MNKYKIIALFGKSGAGKDTIQEWMITHIPNTHGIVSYTTRRPRDGEIEGVDYHFIDNETFTMKVLNNEMLEATEFNDWFYGTAIDSLDANKVNVGVFNIIGIESLLAAPNLDVLPVFVDAYDEIRLRRCLNREKHPNCKEICRRFLADEADFCDIDFPYVTYLNINDDRGFFNIQNLPEVKEFLRGQN